jgi:hypothetical protein
VHLGIELHSLCPTVLWDAIRVDQAFSPIGISN